MGTIVICFTGTGIFLFLFFFCCWRAFFIHFTGSVMDQKNLLFFRAPALEQFRHEIVKALPVLSCQVHDVLYASGVRDIFDQCDFCYCSHVRDGFL